MLDVRGWQILIDDDGGSTLATLTFSQDPLLATLEADDKRRYVWIDMLCASQNLLAGKYEDAVRFPKGTPGHAALAKLTAGQLPRIFYQHLHS